MLGNLAYELGEPVDQVIKSGTGNIWNYYQKIVNKFINFFPVFLSNWVRLGDVFYYTAHQFSLNSNENQKSFLMTHLMDG